MNIELILGGALGGAFIVSLAGNVIEGGAIAFLHQRQRSAKEHIKRLDGIIEGMAGTLKKAGLHTGWGVDVTSPGSPGSGLAKIVEERGYKKIGGDDEAIWIGIDPDNAVEIVVHSSNPHGHDWATKTLDAAEATQLVDMIMDASTKTRSH